MLGGQYTVLPVSLLNVSCTLPYLVPYSWSIVVAVMEFLSSSRDLSPLPVKNEFGVTDQLAHLGFEISKKLADAKSVQPEQALYSGNLQTL